MLVSRGSSVLAFSSPTQQAQWEPLNLGDYKVGYASDLTLSCSVRDPDPGPKVPYILDLLDPDPFRPAGTVAAPQLRRL